MQEHSLVQEDFAQTIRHTSPTIGEGCYEWSLPDGHPLIEELCLPQGRIMRACCPKECDQESPNRASGDVRDAR